MIINYFSDFCFPGGIPVHQGEIAKILDSQFNHEIRICIPWPLRYDMVEHKNTIEQHFRNNTAEEFYDGLKYICKIDSKKKLKSVINSADINHFHGSFSTNRKFLGEAINLSKNIEKNVYTFHSEAVNPKCLSDNQELIHRLNKISYICAVSNNVKKAVSSITNRKITVVNNGYSLSTGHHKKNSALNILFVGRLNKTKGIENVLCLIDDLKETNTTFTIVGDSEFDAIYHKKMVNISKYNSNVEWIKKSLSHRELLNLYSRSDIFYFPSHMEGRPLVVLDAIKNGCIPVVSYAGGMNEIINDGENGFISEYYDYSRQLNCIKELIQNETLRNYLQTNARNTELDSWEKAAKKLNQIYLNIYETHHK